MLSSEARTLMASDILISTDRPWQSGTPERIAARVDRIPDASRIDSIEMVTMARPADERVDIAKVVELRAVQAGFPFYGQLTLQDGSRIRIICSRTTARSCARSCFRSSASLSATPSRLAKRSSSIRGLISLEPGRSLSAFSLGPRVLIDYEDLAGNGLAHIRQPCVAADAASRSRIDDRRARARSRERLRIRIRPRAQLSRSAGADRRGLRAGRELSQSRRSRHRRAGRHRRVERHARVRAAEDQEHRRHEMRRRHKPADSRCVSAPDRSRLASSAARSASSWRGSRLR